MKQGKNKTGWTIPRSKHERSVRDDSSSWFGYGIWELLVAEGFVHKGHNHYSKNTYDEKLTLWERKLKRWLILGYWEDDDDTYRLGLTKVPRKDREIKV